MPMPLDPGELEAIVASLAQQISQPRGGTSNRKVQQMVADAVANQTTGNGFPTRFAEQVLLEHTDIEWVPNTWIPLTAPIPSGAKIALIRFGLDATSDADEDELLWDAPGVVNDPQATVRIKSGENDDHPRMVDRVIVDSAGGFRVYIDETGGSGEGFVSCVGYEQW